MFLLVRISIVLILVIAQVFLWNAVQKSALQLHSGQTKKDQLVLVAQKLTEAKEAFAAAQPRLLQLSDSFPASKTIPQVVGHIEALADTQQVPIELKSIEDGTSMDVQGGKITTKKIEIRITGAMESVFSFLEAIEHQKEFASVESWDIANNTQGESSVSSVFQMTLHTVYYFYDANN